jgi:hypothetical protein
VLLTCLECNFSLDYKSSVFFNFVFKTKEEVKLQGRKDRETAKLVAKETAKLIVKE